MKEIGIYGIDGQSQSSILLFDGEVEKSGASPRSYACAVRVLLQNARQGTVGCKGRGEVSFSNKKPWKQKGTGRARAGSLRSPLWRKGGVTFGPSARVRELGMARRQVRAVLNELFFSYLENEKIFGLDFEVGSAPSTKKAALLLKNMKIQGQKPLLFLPFDDEVTFASFRNIPGVRVVSFDQPNALDLSRCGSWCFLKRDTEQFKGMVSKWI
jgi:large subunit ribosomal protein L4